MSLSAPFDLLFVNVFVPLKVSVPAFQIAPPPVVSAAPST